MNRMKVNLVIGILIVIIGVIAVTQIAVESSAATLTVDDDGNAEYTNILNASSQ